MSIGRRWRHGGELSKRYKQFRPMSWSMASAALEDVTLRKRPLSMATH